MFVYHNHICSCICMSIRVLCKSSLAAVAVSRHMQVNADGGSLQKSHDAVIRQSISHLTFKNKLSNLFNKHNEDTGSSHNVIFKQWGGNGKVR